MPPGRRRRLVVAGGGVAGLRAIEALRKGGYDGSIDLVCGEDQLPYNRPPLSKEVLTGAKTPESTYFRSAEHFTDLDVSLHLGKRASMLDLSTRSLHVARRELAFDELIVCTGSRARQLPGEPLSGVHALRTLEDSRAIRDAMQASARVVVLGGGIIGSEIASSARSRGLDVTMIEREPLPMVRAVGPVLAPYFVDLHRTNGVDVRCGVSISALEGSGRIEQVRLTTGERIACDLLVVGLGSVPNTDWLVGSALHLDDGLICDARLGAGAEGVFGAGDVVRWPNGRTDSTVRGEQWTSAVEQGRYVAQRILGRPDMAPFVSSHYFWTDIYGLRIQAVGRLAGAETHVDGSLEDGDFIAYERRGDRLSGALAIQRPIPLMKAKQQVEAEISWAEAVPSTATLIRPTASTTPAPLGAFSVPTD